MRYKSKVLARYPDARLVTIDRTDDGTPCYQRVVTGPEWGEVILDIHDIESRGVQRANNAWRSAYFWIVRRRMETRSGAAAHNAREEAAQ